MTFEEKARFADAPKIMEFRKEKTDEEKEDACESFNRRQLYATARRDDVPVAKFNAAYEGLQHATGAEYDEAFFWGLPRELELCEGAPVLVAKKNLWVAGGIMNGTRGSIRAIVYRRGSRPDRDDPQRRLQDVLLVECPGNAGESFFDSGRCP